MAQYLLSVHSGPTSTQPADEQTDGQAAEQAIEQGSELTPERAREEQMRSYQRLLALEEEMKAAGGWLFSGRLTGPETATVVDGSGAAVVMTDGPYVETKEQLAGFYIVEAADLDVALDWAARTSAIIGRPIEVRPFWDSKQA